LKTFGLNYMSKNAMFFKATMSWKPYGYYIESFLGTYIANVSWEAQWALFSPNIIEYTTPQDAMKSFLAPVIRVHSTTSCANCLYNGLGWQRLNKIFSKPSTFFQISPSTCAFSLVINNDMLPSVLLFSL
jgi:hypothetical protein